MAHCRIPNLFFLPFRVDFHFIIEIVDDFEHLPRLSVSAPSSRQCAIHTLARTRTPRPRHSAHIADLTLNEELSRPLAGFLVAHEVPLTAKLSTSSLKGEHKSKNWLFINL